MNLFDVLILGCVKEAVEEISLIVNGLDRGSADFVSDSVKERLNRETETILKDCLENTERFLLKERDLLDKMAEALLANEELEYDDVADICKTYGITKQRRVEEEGVLQRFQEKMGLIKETQIAQIDEGSAGEKTNEKETT